MATVNSINQRTIEQRPRVDAVDRASCLSKQLSALLLSLYGESFETFDNLNETSKEHILWLASDLAAELNSLVTEIALS